MEQYLNLLTEIKSKGTKKEDRTGTGTISIFGHQMRFDLNDGFPLVTTKKVNFNAILHELLWFIKGDTNTRWHGRYRGEEDILGPYIFGRGTDYLDTHSHENRDLGVSFLRSQTVHYK